AIFHAPLGGALTSVEMIYREDRSLKAIERQFSPEFRNRLTAVIEFSSLNQENVTKVVAKQLALLQERLNAKQIELEFQEDVLKYIAAQAYTPEFGARPVQRWLDTHISKRISEEILFGVLKSGGRTKLATGENGIEFEFLAGKKS
ncbi:hypothetical protein CH375_21505, partial [Leptospira ellisii]